MNATLRRRALTALCSLSAVTALTVAAPAWTSPATATDLSRQAPPTVNAQAITADFAAVYDLTTKNGGNRYTGSAGHHAYLNWLAQRLQQVGYTVNRHACPASACTQASENLTVDIPGSDPSSMYILGGHTDGVRAGAGMNDNASGSLGVLHVALALKQLGVQPKHTIRLGWWTDEEQFFRGSGHYVKQVLGADAAKVKGYINFDMIASTNNAYFINNIDTALGKSLKAYLDAKGIQTEENYEGQGRSDDGQFKKAGILTTAFATGASQPMTPDQAKKWNGKANKSFDACYHQACDVFPKNINIPPMEIGINAVLNMLWNLGYQGKAPGSL